MPKHVTDDIDAVVISTAIPETNPELVRARELGIAVWHRAHMLAELGRGKENACCLWHPWQNHHVFDARHRDRRLGP